MIIIDYDKFQIIYQFTQYLHIFLKYSILLLLIMVFIGIKFLLFRTTQNGRENQEGLEEKNRY